MNLYYINATKKRVDKETKETIVYEEETAIIASSLDCLNQKADQFYLLGYKVLDQVQQLSAMWDNFTGDNYVST
jgi:hypothetical protein